MDPDILHQQMEPTRAAPAADLRIGSAQSVEGVREETVRAVKNYEQLRAKGLTQAKGRRARKIVIQRSPEAERAIRAAVESDTVAFDRLRAPRKRRSFRRISARA